MLKIEKFVTMSPEQWEIVIEGMRNPKNSWDRMDSGVCEYLTVDNVLISDFELGDNDHKLMMQLAEGGPVHAKYRRMMPVWVTITAPLYWWKEFDTYKVGTVCNSCSTMHKIQAKEFTLDDFSHEDLIGDWVGDNKDAMYYWKQEDMGWDLFATPLDGLKIVIGLLNANREAYLRTKNKKYWKQMIHLLPTSYNQKRTIMLNYEVLTNIETWRRNHKLDEWHTFCNWLEELPHSEIITGYKE